jgi:hypothetical protein
LLSMRRVAPVLLALAAAGLAACTTTSAKAPERVQTTSQAERENLQGAVGAPLRDLNVLRTKIPPVLLEALADPYYRPPGKLSCSDVAALLKPVDEALGPDLDEPATDDQAGMMEKGRGTALGLVAGATSDVIPFRSWVRRLTGAERHDRYVQAAITGGAVRRGYLKGLGESRGCPPPATPSHVKTGSPVINQDLKPRYPTKPVSATGTPDGTSPADLPQ